MPTGPHYNLLTPKVAIDCEMVTANIGQVLGRVSVVNYNGRTIFDTFVCHERPITVWDTRRRYSGIARRDLRRQNGAMPYERVQDELQELLRGRVVIGHAVHNDAGEISKDLSNPRLWLQRQRGRAARRNMPTVKFDVAGVRDTQKYSGYRSGRQIQSLKNLTRRLLGREIKQGTVSSVEDAAATMELYRLAEEEIDREQRRQRFGF